MTFDLSRRSFGLLTLGAIAAGLPRLGFAQSAGYANPQLLVEPAELIGIVPPMTGSAQSDAPENIALIDVRPVEEYRAGHIPGARHLDPNAVVATQSPVDGSLLSIGDIKALLGAVGIAANRRIVFYDDRGGFHAARMLWLMEYLGHRNVAVVNGGWSSWMDAGGPTTLLPPRDKGATFHAAPSPRRHATADDVLAHRDDPAGMLIDVRPPHMYAEGHIPWAINIPWSQNLGEDGRFRSATDLMAHFENHGVTADRNVIMHCQTGLASSHSYVALRLLGYKRVRVYHRSWAEWGSDPSLPKATA